MLEDAHRGCQKHRHGRHRDRLERHLLEVHRLERLQNHHLDDRQNRRRLERRPDVGRHSHRPEDVRLERRPDVVRRCGCRRLDRHALDDHPRPEGAEWACRSLSEEDHPEEAEWACPTPTAVAVEGLEGDLVDLDHPPNPDRQRNPDVGRTVDAVDPDVVAMMTDRHHGLSHRELARHELAQRVTQERQYREVSQ